MPESTAIEGILRAIVEAMEQREAAEPDLPEWEANDRLRAAEASLLRLYRERGQHPVRRELTAIDIVPASSFSEHTAIEVA